MNENHADDLVVIARAFGHPDATAARVERIATWPRSGGRHAAQFECGTRRLLRTNL
ncbi:MAG: DUF2470 domain-containing protein [Ilumatobacteraceae bacterium]